MKTTATVALLLCFSNIVNCFLTKKDFGEHLLAHMGRWHNVCVHTTGVSEEQISKVQEGIFPEDDIALQRYTFCLWAVSGQMDPTYKLQEGTIWYYIPDMHKEDLKFYLKCNEEALRRDDLDPVQQIWTMQKCIHKEVDNEHYIWF